MKRIISIIVVAVLAVSMLAMTSCGKKEFSGSLDDEKNMTITANRADEGDYFMTGTLEVADGEEVTIDSNLESGSISVQFIGSGGEQNIEELWMVRLHTLLIWKGPTHRRSASARVHS